VDSSILLPLTCHRSVGANSRSIRQPRAKKPDLSTCQNQDRHLRSACDREGRPCVRYPTVRNEPSRVEHAAAADELFLSHTCLGVPVNCGTAGPCGRVWAEDDVIDPPAQIPLPRCIRGWRPDMPCRLGEFRQIPLPPMLFCSRQGRTDCCLPFCQMERPTTVCDYGEF